MQNVCAIIPSLTHARCLVANVLTSELGAASLGPPATTVAASRLWYQRLFLLWLQAVLAVVPCWSRLFFDAFHHCEDLESSSRSVDGFR